MAATGKSFPLHELRILKDGTGFKELLRLFAQHGIRCQDEDGTYLLTFPEGTRCARSFPRIRDERSTAQLADGCTIGYGREYLSGALYLTGGGSIHEHKTPPLYMQPRAEEVPTDAER